MTEIPGPSRTAASPPIDDATEPERALSRLATSLFDLRAAYETDLRALTAIQRSLERIRCAETRECEKDLLLGEIARHLAALEGGKSGVSVHVAAAVERAADVLAIRR